MLGKHSLSASLKNRCEGGGGGRWGQSGVDGEEGGVMGRQLGVDVPVLSCKTSVL